MNSYIVRPDTTVSDGVSKVDTGNRYEITFDPHEEFFVDGGGGASFRNYSPVIDSYQAVLGPGQPILDVILNVTPQTTRTLKSDAAFNPDANFGENKAVQVSVATNHLQVQLTGSAVANEVLDSHADRRGQRLDRAARTPGL